MKRELPIHNDKMKGVERMAYPVVTLAMMLNAREERMERQKEILTRYRTPLISMTMNIPGARKNSALISFAFFEKMEKLKRRIHAEPLEQRVTCEAAGCEALLPYRMDPKLLKATAVALEEEDRIGRLLDIDVLDCDGEKLSRSVMRPCLVCGGPVFLCSRSQRHSAEELQRATDAILLDYAAERIAVHAVQALIDEVEVTPKPGLVDMRNSGAHTDMSLQLMRDSAESLFPFFKTAASFGLCGCDRVEELQAAGVQAEERMLSVTGGVNTHKGAIFSLGLLCAAKGGDLTERGDVFSLAAEYAAGIRTCKTNSHGTIIKRALGVGGAREEALAGFPTVRRVYAQLKQGCTPHEVLLWLMANVMDTNVLWRGGLEGQKYVRQEAERILNAVPSQREALMQVMDDACIERNLSPGGCADLLAVTLFLRSFDAQ